MFSRNVLTLLQHLIKDGKTVIDLNDEITGPMCVTLRRTSAELIMLHRKSS